MDRNLQLYLIILFIAVVVISQTILISTTGNRAKRSRLMRAKLKNIEEQGTSNQSLLRINYLEELSPTERWLENNAFGEYMSEKLAHAGLEWKAYKTTLWLLSACLLSLIGSLLFFNNIMIAFIVPALLIVTFTLFLRHKAEKRMQLFEAQFIEAIDVMKRALLVGYPFTEVMKTVSQEMAPPISTEFGKTFMELNYGADLRTALNNLAQRNPSVSVLAFNSAVIIQKETGGNLAETLDKISNVLRGRFRFLRKVKTLSAEGRMSAWVLMLVPFVLFLVLYTSNPEYLTPLFTTEKGINMLQFTGISMIAGLIWIRKLLRIEV
ncbi:type II secretion system F family protein [Photobacterium sp. BZF1]|uniref:type II secretion system F family protein n=1 Tax=Photobacterium sp. BZF1 TaxID=1904457 RepID=UPI0016539C46|nr:type II secretion system F family protein [Photobacterium sp. BZF1]MBC7002824.1 type II secretion system F family protein [Photobacterium sp. BZF1]